MLPSLHDDLVISYEVDCEARTIKVRTRRPNCAEVPSRRTLSFNGVLGYHFRDDSFSNIIMTLEVIPIDGFLKQYGSEIAEAFSRSGALEPWALNVADASKALHKSGVTAVTISSVMGLEGWVLAKDVSVVTEATS